jgi:hypothetical protein
MRIPLFNIVVNLPAASRGVFWCGFYKGSVSQHLPPDIGKINTLALI